MHDDIHNSSSYFDIFGIFELNLGYILEPFCCHVVSSPGQERPWEDECAEAHYSHEMPGRIDDSDDAWYIKCNPYKIVIMKLAVYNSPIHGFMVPTEQLFHMFYCFRREAFWPPRTKSFQHVEGQRTRSRPFLNCMSQRLFVKVGKYKTVHAQHICFNNCA